MEKEYITFDDLSSLIESLMHDIDRLVSRPEDKKRLSEKLLRLYRGFSELMSGLDKENDMLIERYKELEKTVRALKGIKSLDNLFTRLDALERHIQSQDAMLQSLNMKVDGLYKRKESELDMDYRRLKRFISQNSDRIVYAVILIVLFFVTVVIVFKFL